MKVIEYVTAKGKNPFREWLNQLDGSIRFRIQARIMRLKDFGQFGASRELGSQLFELKFKAIGGGTRVYYGIDSDVVVILLLGGNKHLQHVDISKAREYWNDYLNNKEEI